MGFNCGIVGLPNVGKSTLFNAITAAGAKASNFPFCTIEPNVGLVKVPDPRLDTLAELVKPDKIIYTSQEFVDIAGLVQGASKGEGLGNKFLSHIRQVDAIAHIVRCFDDDNIIHVHNRVSPKDDIEIINAELILSDMDTIDRRIKTLSKASKSGDKKLKENASILGKVLDMLQREVMVCHMDLNDRDQEALLDLHLITNKPIFYVANVPETDIINGNSYVDEVRAIAKKEKTELILICAQLESEIAELDGDEKKSFLNDYGLTFSGLDQMVRTGYNILELITYFTAGKVEVRAWTIEKGTLAPGAAGKIHTDFERGFIKAEVISYEDFVMSKSEAAARDKGVLRLEGKEYLVQDGDVMHFKFNV